MKGSLIRTPRRCGGIHAENDNIRQLLINLSSSSSSVFGSDSENDEIDFNFSKF